MKKFAVVLMSVTVCVVVSTLRANAADDIRAQIEAANRGFEAAFARGDAAGVAGCYTADGQILPPGSGPLTGTDAIAAFWAQGMQAGLASVRLTTVEVEQHDDTAIEVGRAEIRDKEQQVLDSANYLVVWKRVGGAWKLHRDIWNSSVPAAQ